MVQELPPIQDQKLFKQALTHRSYINEHPHTGQHNERLEFLGDAVLGFIVGEFLYHKYPHFDEAQLTRLRANLVNEQQFAYFARLLDAGQKMRLGRGAEQEGGRDNPALLCDVFEALIGAYFCEAGIEAVKRYVEPFLLLGLDKITQSSPKNPSPKFIDPKNQFQQWALAKHGENPEYLLREEFGPDHAKEFIIEVRVAGKVYGVGQGRKKQAAEKQAAEKALKQLGV
ncbi:ribonuclease III [Spirulina subsalsa]|uniref:ribonuclease III n=1 Tax=Spirulina subsalsa TaxID=54311 RepID=UPI000372C3F5|nr:ribonuclease III [Spirulina subsalsa]